MFLAARLMYNLRHNRDNLSDMIDACEKFSMKFRIDDGLRRFERLTALERCTWNAWTISRIQDHRTAADHSSRS